MHIAEDELCRILDHGDTIPLGVEPGTTKLHRLLYSPADEACIVVVQDTRNGEVITALYPDFDNFCRVSWQTIRELECRHGKYPAELTRKAVAQPTKFTQIIFTIYFRKLDRKLKQVYVRLSSSEYPLDKTALARDSSVSSQIRDAIRLNGLNGEVFEDVWVQFGRSGMPEKFPFEM